jgi:hypothetical protein
MFRSKVRPIIIPQYEHGRLSGTLAALWGNQDFDRPALDFASFVHGVTFHDWHYGLVDNLGIGEASQDEWLDLVCKGVEYWFEDPVSDIVAKLHLQRLLQERDSPKITEFLKHIEARIIERLQQTRFSIEPFEWADRITACCDQIAFDFSFEIPIRASVKVFARRSAEEATDISYEIRQDGEIAVDPWPFGVDSFQGILTGYQVEGYPEKLMPEIIHFNGKRGL